MGYGAVIRNHIGLVMAAGLIRGFFYDDVDTDEAEALRFSIQLARETGLSPLIVEPDSLHVIQVLLRAKVVLMLSYYG